MNTTLFSKYDQALPRYTSYPTVPYWGDENPSEAVWKQAVADAWSTGGKNISLYVHLPFCESLCTYCACNTRITHNHGVEEPYILHLLREWSMYLDVIGETPSIRELHLGGGTPTFFSPERLGSLIDALRETATFPKDAALSFEAHPANTTREHLEVLYKRGFRRISLGIQDFNPVVQQTINRHQTAAQVQAITNLSRLIGYTSINFDLIYGLPKQTVQSVCDTVKKVIDIRPDRIAFYSYAHVPWKKPGQRAYTEKDLPEGEQKRELFEAGRALLLQEGYEEIGLDHFALPGDELKKAGKNGKLHRNFMGYTDKETKLLIGLGVSAISDAGTMLMQNIKDVETWTAEIDKGKLPVFRAHELTREDLVLKQHILNIMCRGNTSWKKKQDQVPSLAGILERLQPLGVDGLIDLDRYGLRVTEAGKPFLRNIAACFDERMHAHEPGKPIFSRTA